jgi:CubicO group peptidase (beta-lactamase class C family)
MAEQSCQRLYVVLPCDEATLDVPLKHHADIEGGPGGRFLAHLLLIARHGHLALEEYFYGFDQDWVHDMRSAGKTFAPVLAGIAKDQGATLTPQTPIYPLFTQYSSFANPDARKQKIVLRDIMTMTAGNACDDNNDDSPGNEDRMQSDEKQRDWYKYSLDLPMLKDPGGEDAVYCSGDLNLVGGAVAAATHRWLPEFFEKKLARPLQFGRYYLNLMPDGQAYMGGGAYLRPRDQLKLGQLYLDRGLWNGKQIVSKEWVGEPMTVHSHFAARYSLGQQHEYGYGWHIHYLKSGAKPIGYLQPREMADSSSSSCLISTSLWGSRAAAMVSSTNGIDGSWSLCRSSLSLPLSQYIAIKQNGTLSETLVTVNYLPSFIVFGPVAGSQRAHHRHASFEETPFWRRGMPCFRQLRIVVVEIRPFRLVGSRSTSLCKVVQQMRGQQWPWTRCSERIGATVGVSSPTRERQLSRVIT